MTFILGSWPPASRPFPPLEDVLGIFSNVGFTGALPKSSSRPGTAAENDQDPRRRRAGVQHIADFQDKQADGSCPTMDDIGFIMIELVERLLAHNTDGVDKNACCSRGVTP